MKLFDLLGRWGSLQGTVKLGVAAVPIVLFLVAASYGVPVSYLFACALIILFLIACLEEPRSSGRFFVVICISFIILAFTNTTHFVNVIPNDWKGQLEQSRVLIPGMVGACIVMLYALYIYAKEISDSYEETRISADSVYYLGFTLTLLSLFIGITLFGVGRKEAAPSWYTNHFDQEAALSKNDTEKIADSTDQRDDLSQSVSEVSAGNRKNRVAGTENKSSDGANEKAVLNANVVRQVSEEGSEETSRRSPLGAAKDPQLGKTSREVQKLAASNEGVRTRAMILLLVTQNGTALLTTIFGIIGRVLLIHFRTQGNDSPLQARIFTPETGDSEPIDVDKARREIRKSLHGFQTNIRQFSHIFGNNAHPGDPPQTVEIEASTKGVKESLDALKDRIDQVVTYPEGLGIALRMTNPQERFNTALKKLEKGTDAFAASIADASGDYKVIHERLTELSARLQRVLDNLPEEDSPPAGVPARTRVTIDTSNQQEELNKTLVEVIKRLDKVIERLGT